MARPTKTGLDYYNIDTDFFANRKIRRLVKSFGAKGYLIYMYILTEIYRDKGCFLQWDENTAFDVADYLNVSEKLIKEVLNYCFAMGLFNKELFISEKIITSKNIQERWETIVSKTKRKTTKVGQINPKYSLTPYKTEFTPEETEFTPEEIPQSKGKESKINDDDEKGKKPPSPPSSNFDDSYFAIEVLAKEYLQDTKTVDAVVKNKANKFKDKFHLKEMLIKFVYHLMEIGVKTKTKADFASHFRNWNKKQPPETEEEKQLQKQDLLNNF